MYKAVFTGEFGDKTIGPVEVYASWDDKNLSTIFHSEGDGEMEEWNKNLMFVIGFFYKSWEGDKTHLDAIKSMTKKIKLEILEHTPDKFDHFVNEGYKPIKMDFEAGKFMVEECSVCEFKSACALSMNMGYLDMNSSTALDIEIVWFIGETE